MTDADVIPHRADSPADGVEKALWPASTQFLPTGEVSVGGVQLREVAAKYGTPTYLLDLAEFEQRCHAYQSAFGQHEVAYAGKALLTRAVVRMIDRRGMSLDVCSGEELTLALSASFPARRIILHGNATSPALLMRAVVAGVGRIVVDSHEEIDTVARLASGVGRQQVFLRVTLGVDPRTYPAATTGADTQKFGLSIDSGAATDAIRRVLASPKLDLVGVHCHLGSQVSSTEPYERAMDRIVGFLAEIRDVATMRELNFGGGHAIAYTEHDHVLTADDVAEALQQSLSSACARHRLERPRLTVEPGRAIAGPSGITLYRVLAVKRAATRTWVTVDGGMSDNPRPALHGARHTARLIGRMSQAPDAQVTIVGRHCEAGDILVDGALMPNDLEVGDLIAMPATGAQHYSTASTDTMRPRPPLIGVHAGRTRTLVRRETGEDLLSRDLG